MKRWVLVLLALGLVASAGCASMGGALLNDQSKKAAILIKGEAELLAQNPDQAVSAAGAKIANAAMDIVLNCQTEESTTYEGFDLSLAPPYSHEASVAARVRANKEHESGGVFGSIISAVKPFAPWVGWIAAAGAGVLAFVRGRKGQALLSGLVATVTGVQKFQAGDATAGEALVGILKDEHVQASVMPVIQDAIRRAAGGNSGG